MTGGARGFCAVPYPAADVRPFAGRGFTRGRGWRRAGRQGFGRGWLGYGYPAELTGAQEADMLKDQANAIAEELKAINSRIAELEKEK